MQMDKVFRLTPDEFTALAAQKLGEMHGLPSGNVTANMRITTDGKAAEVTSVWVTFHKTEG